MRGLRPSSDEVPLDRKESGGAERTRARGLRGRNYLPYWFILPSVVLLAGIMLYPMILGLYYSLKDRSLLESGSFVWLNNYLELLSMPEFWNALRFSAIFAFFGVFGSYLLGLGFALLLNEAVPARGFFRVALLVPWIIPAVVSVASWRWLIGDESGLVNTALEWMGIGPIQFLATERGAIFSVILIKIWRSFPFMMISCLAALQAIDRDLYEAAKIDGAGAVKSFWYITVPHIRTISIVMWILMTIWCFNDFETIWLLTQGGPSNATENLIVLAYIYTFTKNSVGIGSSIAVVSLVILMVLAVLMLRKQAETD
jgi:ABC-type sugar transport system permease subunit